VTIDSTAQERILDTFGFLGNADEELRQRLFQKAAIVALEQGQFVCHEGHECSHLALVLSGTARVYKLGESGREITLYRVGPGESCILTASCILSSAPFPAFAVCEDRVEAAVVPAKEMRQWIAQSTIWRDYVFGLVAQRMGDIISLVEEVVFRRMDRRIADYLLQRFTPKNGKIEITHQIIASDLGTSREVVSRILKEFESRGLILVTRGAVELLDEPLLQERVEHGV
jgi:CRP/FNR family transcriptional regulator, anaerobic regulatory protein